MLSCALSDSIPTPGATRSGLAIKSSDVGPRELNTAIWSSARAADPMWLDAPTVSTHGAFPGAVIPLVVNVLQHPLPSHKRCFSLGKALRKAILSYPENLKVAMVGTGGLSHQMIGERAGFNNESWDLEFLDLIDRDPERLAKMSIEDFMELGGNEGAEVIMWLIMRGALGEGARKVHQNYYLPMTTAMAVALFE